MKRKRAQTSMERKALKMKMEPENGELQHFSEHRDKIKAVDSSMVSF